MARDENPPFPRGSTFYDGGTIDSNNLQAVNLEGKVYTFEDVLLSDTGSVKSVRTGRPVKCMIVRNVGAAALLPKQAVTLQLSAGIAGRVDGQACTTAVETYPIDEFLPTAGCPVNDLCYVVIEGPALMRTDLAAGANNLIAVGDTLVALTAATSGATTAGRVKPQDLTGATALLGKEVMNRIGRALSAKTTAQTNGDVLVDIRKW